MLHMHVSSLWQTAIGVGISTLSVIAFGLMGSEGSPLLRAPPAVLAAALIVCRAVGGVGATIAEAGALTLATMNFSENSGMLLSSIELVIGVAVSVASILGAGLYSVGASTTFGAFLLPFAVAAALQLTVLGFFLFVASLIPRAPTPTDATTTVAPLTAVSQSTPGCLTVPVAAPEAAPLAAPISTPLALPVSSAPSYVSAGSTQLLVASTLSPPPSEATTSDEPPKPIASTSASLLVLMSHARTVTALALAFSAIVRRGSTLPVAFGCTCAQAFPPQAAIAPSKPSICP